MLAPDHVSHTRRLTLRPFTTADAVRVVAIKSNWNVARMLRLAPYPPSLQETQAWLGHHVQEWLDGTAFRFAIEFGGQVIGCTDVDEIGAGSGSLGYWLEQAFWGHGFAGEAAAELVRLCFGPLGLARLVSGHASDNPASGRVLTKLGFLRVGEETRWSLPRSAPITHLVYELHRA